MKDVLFLQATPVAGVNGCLGFGLVAIGTVVAVVSFAGDRCAFGLVAIGTIVAIGAFACCCLAIVFVGIWAVEGVVAFARFGAAA